MRHPWSWPLFLLLGACSSFPVGLPRLAPPPPDHDQIVIVGTNDFHGYLRTVESEVGGQKVLLGGAEWFAGYADILDRKFGDHLVLLDGGDMWQGTMESNDFRGRSVVDFYNLLPYRAVSVGNHEFDYGPEERGGKDPLGAVKARMRQAKYPFVQANIFDRKTGALWREKNLQPSVIVSAAGYKVGIIGLTTTSTPGKTLPRHVEGLEFRDFIEPTLAEARKLRAQGADLVVATMHEGEGKPGDPVHKLLHGIPAGTLDAVVSGHSHTEVHEMVNGVPVIQSRTRGIYFGRIDLFVDRKTRRVDQSLTKIHDMHWICGTWFRTREDCDQKAAKDDLASGKVRLGDLLPLRTPVYEGEPVRPSAAVREVLKPYFEQSDRKRHEVLGQAERDFDWYPSGENQMGTLILDAFHERFPEAKAILMNGGGIRRRLFKGPITYGDIYELSPFDNFAVLVEVTGKQLREMVRVLTAGQHAVPMLWGVSASYFDRDDPAFARDVNGDGKNEKWERDRLKPRTGLVWEKSGKPVGDRERFWLATIDYLAAGGDNLAHVFREIPMAKRRYFDQGPRDLVADYLRRHPGITVPRTDVMRMHGEK